METPTLEKPFICDLCSMSFSRNYHLIRHRRIHDNRFDSCKFCKKQFNRKDSLQRHGKICQKEKDKLKQHFCEYCSKTFTKQFCRFRHETTCQKKNHETVQLRKHLMEKADAYRKQLTVGRTIAECLHNTKSIPEECLSEEHKRALQLYRQSRHTMDMDAINLRPWQDQTVKLVENKNHRKVIWIVGEHGNEGKTFVQQYIQHHYGDRRVVVTDIAGRKRDIAHYLSKLPLECKDIFLFNHPASSSDCIAYDLLEAIKDGSILSHKYNTCRLAFTTPNVVMVFSNQHPNTSSLKRDRWEIYEIKDGNLNSVDARGGYKKRC